MNPMSARSKPNQWAEKISSKSARVEKATSPVLLAARFVAGAAIKRRQWRHLGTKAFRTAYGNDVTPLFIPSDRGQVTIITADTKVTPIAGQAISALVSPPGNAILKENPSPTAS